MTTAYATTEHYLKEELYQKIHESDEIFEWIQDGSLDGIWYWDLENPENEWYSDKFWTTLGYEPGEFPYTSEGWMKLIHPEDLKIALDNFEKHKNNPNHRYDQIVRYRHKNGSIVWIRCRGLVKYNQNGKPVRMLGAHVDLTAFAKTLEVPNKYRQELSAVINRIYQKTHNEQ